MSRAAPVQTSRTRPTRTTAKKKPAPKKIKAASSSSSSRPSLRDAQRALTRDRILEAATTRFARVGYGATTVDDLVTDAGIGRATFYLHFSSLQDVMEALLEAVLPRVDRQYDALMALRVVDEPGIVSWLEGFFAFYAAHTGVLRASMQAETVDDRWSARLEAVSWRFVERFSPRGEGGDGPRRQVQAMILLQELDRIAYLVEVRGWHLDRKAAVAVLADHWCAFMNARP